MNTDKVRELARELDATLSGLRLLRGRAGNSAEDERRISIAITHAETALLWLKEVL